MAPRCEVCTELLNRSDHKQVECPYCPYVACTSCHERYLLDITEDAHCMACHKAWSRDTLASNFTSKFVTKTYKGRREDLLFERERSLMPATQQYVELEKKIRQLAQQEVQLRVKLVEENENLARIRNLSTSVIAVRYGLQTEFEAFILRQQMVAIQMKVISPIQIDIDTSQWQQIQMRVRIVGRNVEMEKRAFVRACPHDACKGFLSTAWKCGLCENWTCPTCHEVKGPEKDAAHTCNPNNVATAELLARDSRNCPTCAAGIFKINGCFAKDTVIPLFDGTTKLAQDISTGDVLIGDDGKARTVMETCSGRDDMFKVIQNKGVEYTVNSKHKLVLKFSGDRSIHKLGEAHVVRWFDRTLKSIKSKKFENIQEAVDFHKGLQFSDEIEMLVEDYVNLSDSTKKFMMGFKSSGVHWPKKEVLLDPYIMGLWIGDGVNNGTSFAANDTEILERLLEWCEENEAELVHSGPYKFDVRRRNGTQGRLAIGRGSASSECKGCLQKFISICDTPNKPYEDDDRHLARFNPMKHSLDSYKLVRNKHIPLDYIVNDRDTRLKVLAGLIDSDGHVSYGGKRVVVIQTCPKITKQIEFIARSLGFTVSVTTCERRHVSIFGGEPKDYRDSHRINISGEHLEEIPTILPRKKCVNSTPNKDGLRTSIIVEPLGQGTYYGWSIDGNKRFVLDDLTVARNCDQMWCTQCHTAFSWRTGRVETHMVHNPHYYEYQRAHGTPLPRAVGDVPCGGFPEWSVILKLVGGRQSIQTNGCGAVQEVINAYRSHPHAMYSLIPRYTEQDRQTENRDLRIKFMIGDITDDEFKKKIQQHEKANQRKRAIRQVIEMYTTVITDLFQAFQENRDILVLHESLCGLRDHYTATLKKVQFAYKCAVPDLGSNFNFRV